MSLHSADLQGDWLVIGWFTPDYRPLAKRFAANLAEHGNPYSLLAKSKSDGWLSAILRKPSVVLEAMNTYPGKTLVLMDVDCIVRGDVSPVTDIAGDVGLNVFSREVRLRGLRRRRGIAIQTVSRVVVFRPTEGARRFAQEWERKCRNADGDEAAMAEVYLSCRGVAFSNIDRRYAGLEIRENDTHNIVVHDSAHDHQRRRNGPKSAKQALKIVERWFRTGRTRAAKEAGLG